ncbi:MAG: hypothetical protein WC346_12715 [Methanogenium sp.]|jgi:hypothetical protein
MKTIGIIGTRRKDDEEHFLKVEETFLYLYRIGDTICSGLCPKGADRFAVILAEKYKTKTLWFPANWKKYGKIAGFVRNTDIAKNSDILIALVADDRTGGTEDTIRKFIEFKGGSKYLVILL